MTEQDFISVKEILKFTGWAEKTFKNVRSLDHTHPQRCRGKIHRYPKSEWFRWYQNKGKR